MEIIIAIAVGVIIWFILKGKKAANETKASLVSNSVSYAYNIVGEQSYQNNLKKIAGPKEEESKFFECYAKVSSEPFNQYDKNAVKNAVKVEINGLLVGYLSRGEAAKLAGKVVNKTVPAVIDGGWKDEESTGSYGVKLAINNVNDLI